MMPVRIDLAGWHQPPPGRWLVIGPAGRNRHRSLLWRCRCDCGTEKVKPTNELTCGASLSCGCLRAEQLAARNREQAGRNREWAARTGRAKPSRNCDHCGREYVPYTARSRYCTELCRGRARWQRIAADPERRAAHSRRVTEEHKRDTHVDHAACGHCGRPFHGPPLRLHCSRRCLAAAIAGGKYRDAFHRRRVAAEAVELAAELGRRMRTSDEQK